MEPFSFIIQVVAAAALSASPTAPTTLPGTIDAVSVANTSVITQTATKINEEKAAVAEKAKAEAAKKEVEEKEIKKKVEKAVEETKEKAKAETAKTAEKEKLHLPLKAGTYSYVSDYGLRCAPVTGAGNFHTGMDLAAPTGTDMFSIANGTVVSVTDGSGSVGGDVRIESTINGKLMTIRYHHMGNSTQYVKVGDKVKAGEQISDVASTGMSTGPHLHLEVFDGKFSDYKHIDPEDYFDKIGLKVVEGATANYVNPHDHHPETCPGGNEAAPTSPTNTIPLNAASASRPSQPSQPAAKPAPASPSRPATPAPSKAPAPRPATPAPRPTTPAPAPSKAPVVVPTAPPVAVTPSPAPSATAKATAPVVEVEVTVP